MTESSKDKVNGLHLLALVLVVIVNGLAMVVFLQGTDTCSNYINPDESPVSDYYYYDIPSECLNQMRMYPDEEFTDGGITYKYTEYPRSGWASIVAMYPDDDGIRSLTLGGFDGMFRGRYVINNTHNSFMAYKSPPEYDWNWTGSSNTTYNWSWYEFGNESQQAYITNTSPLPEGCYQNETGQDPNDLVMHFTCPDGGSS